MSTLSLRKIKHDSSSVDNITLDSNGRVGVQQASPNVPFEVGGSWRLGTNTSGTYTGGLGGGFNPNNNIYSMYCRDRTDTNWNDLWIEAKTLSLKSNGSNTAIYIDQSGRVTTPYQTYALCGFTSAYNNFTVSSNNDIIMDTATQQGSSYNTSNGRFTAPVNGLYHIFISLMMNPPSTNANRLVLRKNGSDFQISFDAMQPANGFLQSTGGGSQQSNLNLTAILPLSAGDYVNFAARAGTSVGPIYGGHSWGFFYLIG